VGPVPLMLPNPASSCTRDLQEAAVLSNIRTRFERQLIYVRTGLQESPGGTAPPAPTASPCSPADLYRQHPGVGESLPPLQHLWDGAGAAVRRQGTGREPAVSTALLCHHPPPEPKVPPLGGHSDAYVPPPASRPLFAIANVAYSKMMDAKHNQCIVIR